MEKDGVLFRFYALEVEDASHPELSLLRITPTMANMMDPQERLQLRMTGFGQPRPPPGDVYDGFWDVKGGLIQLTGLPDETLRHNYLLAIRALRFAANFDIPIEPNTWLAIVRSSTRVLDYVPAADIMDEWRKVAAESMYRFVKLMFDAHILQGLIPEVAPWPASASAATMMTTPRRRSSTTPWSACATTPKKASTTTGWAPWPCSSTMWASSSPA